MEAACIKTLLNWTMYLPMLVVAAPVLVLLFNLLLGCIPSRKKLHITLSLKGVLVCFGISVGLSLWGIYYAVLPFEGEELLEPPLWERIIASLMKALKVFGLEDGFSQLVQSGQKMIGHWHWPEETLERFGIFSGVLYVMAPLIGGFGLVQFFAGLFPRFRYWLAGWIGWQEKYYFSQLSDASLALAESLSQVQYRFSRPLLVFTGIGKEEADAEQTKRLAGAKALGAICLKSDLVNTRFPCWGKRKLFLMDAGENGDKQVLRQLVQLAEQKKGKKLYGAEVFLFVNGDAYERVEKNLRRKLLEHYKLPGKKMPVILPVRGDFNLIGNLLADLPLFEPLIGRAKNQDGTQDLHVTILGDDPLAKEMFLATYWIGQVLDCRLCIRVCGSRSEEEFWEQIDRVNPEIRQTVTENHPILRINPQGDMAEPYAHVQYLQCDPRTVRPELTDTDYFFLALGTDRENIALAAALHSYMAEAHMVRQDGSRTVITYVVQDQQLADTLNQKKKFCYADQRADLYMQAVGGLREVYSIRNVFMLGYDRYAEETFDAYDAMNNRAKREKAQETLASDEYKYWANLARSMHMIYKIYSMGMLKTSLFDPEPEEELLQARKAECQQAREIFYGNFPAEFRPDPEKHVQLLHRLAWLEHRRWNAFTRVKGYRYTALHAQYAKAKKEKKLTELKLHVCLVECDQKGIRGQVTPEGKVQKDTEALHQRKPDYDYLDILTYEMYQKGLNSYDFKYYDYPFESVK